MFRFTVMTVFPELFESFRQKGLFSQNILDGKLELVTLNPRDHAQDVHRSVDDRPYGGGDGMVMMPGPLTDMMAVFEAQPGSVDAIKIHLTPQGERLNDKLARELASGSGILLLCGRYGGIDERFVTANGFRDISIGDFILNGGEVAAMALIEAVSRFLPGALGNALSADHDSFSNGLLESPQMTRPPEYKGLNVPEILTSGHHQKIEHWRHLMSLLRTYFRRPDLLNEDHRGQMPEALALWRSMGPNERRACGLPLDC